MSVNRDFKVDINSLLPNFGFNDPMFGDTDVNQSNALLLGATLRTATAYGRSATVQAGEDIRPALNSLKSAGGGTLILLEGTHRPTYDIVGDSKISIVGVGVDQTIIDFEGGAYGVKYVGTASSIIENFFIKDLTIKNSNNRGGLDIEYADNWEVSNILLSSNDQEGVRIQHCQDFIISNTNSDSNTKNGFLFYSDENYTRSTTRFTITNSNTNGNTLSGFSFEIYGFSGAEALDTFTMINCSSVDDGVDGIELVEATNNSIAGMDAKIIGCTVSNSTNNNTYSFLIEANIVSVTVVGCIFGTAGTAAVKIEGDANYFIACSASGRIQSGAFPGWHITGVNNTLVGCSFSTQSVASSILNEDFNNIIDSLTVSRLNSGASPATNIDIENVTNTSGGSLVAGNVVILKSAASGEEITTTTTQGDDKVYGMLLEGLANNADGKILTRGKTKLLKVDGTTDIAIGDFLGTFTSAGIAMKAATGDMAFAIALEAYTTDDSNGVIDALLISPRKI